MSKRSGIAVARRAAAAAIPAPARTAAANMRFGAPSAARRGRRFSKRGRRLKVFPSLTVPCVALAVLATPAMAQMNMPGMTMPMPTKHAAKKKVVGKPKPKATVKKRASAAKPQEPGAAPAASTSPMEGMPMPAQPGVNGPTPMPMDHGHTAGMTMPMGQPGAHQMEMTGALGAYPMQREASGTSWQPDSSEHMGLMTMRGDWMLMAHGDVNLVYDHQSGPRGDDKAFVSGMLMGMAQRPLGNGTLQLKAMLSPDPLMGPRGYPLLLASGETANGRDRLIDRQHPHDLFMELAGSISQEIGRGSSLFL